MRKILTCVMLISLFGSSVLMAADTKPKFECTLTDQMSKDEKPGSNKDTFTTSTPEIFLVCTTADVKKGDVVKALWTAVNTNKVAPDNYQIAEKEVTVDQDLAQGNTFTSNMSLSKPDKGWPVGTYKVDLLLNGNPAVAVDFNVAN